jgi:MinD superfamily P-loop ATPase
MKSIVILSGKGGVGKSSITASLAVALSKTKKIVCADCDVDASNLSLLFNLSEENYQEWNFISTNQKAIIDENKCIFCRKCINICYFKALEENNNIAKVNDFGCEGCGACELICPEDAIKLIDVNNANIGYADTKYGFKIASGQIKPGYSGSGKVVYKVKKKALEISNADFLLIDSAAGIGCPVISSVSGSDYAIIVAEPTPSGFSDLKKAIEIVENFRIKKGIIINKFDLNNDYTEKISLFAKENNIKIIKLIPFDKDFVYAMNDMIPIFDYKKEYEKIFNDIKDYILKEI